MKSGETTRKNETIGAGKKKKAKPSVLANHRMAQPCHYL
jgi:hypothetical protein